MTSPQEQTHEILERLKLRLGPSYEDLEEITWGMKPERAAAYWEEQLRDAQAAERISKFTEEERRAYNEMLSGLRKEATDALYAAHKFSCMLWEQLSEGEEYELNPESYWREIIADARAAAQVEEIEAPPPLPTPAEPPEEEIEAPPPLPTPAG